MNKTEPNPARLKLITRQAAASAAVQGMRAGAEGNQAHHARLQLQLMRASLFWRITFPARLLIDLARGAPPQGSQTAILVRRALANARGQGLRATIAKARTYLRYRAQYAAQIASLPPAAAPAPPLPPANTILAPGVLIIAELTLQQCAKYRVWQKQAFIESLGTPCRVVDWRDTLQCLSAAALATTIILYRVPGYPEILRMISAIERLNPTLAWEVDDLIFDAALYLQNRNIQSLDAEMRDGIINGATLYRAALQACGPAIASTPHLAQLMQQAGATQAHIIENALDAETLHIAETLFATTQKPASPILIGYGSGTKTHDADFAVAAPAILRSLAANPQARLRIVGELNLPPNFTPPAHQLEHLPPVPYARYLELLAECHISIAPLEPSIFNDAKSNIKFLEAAILGLPSICSPAAHFRDVVQHGENALLAATQTEWLEALQSLITNQTLRHQMGLAARATALQRYAPEAIAQTQIKPYLAQTPDARKPAGLRILFANVYFAPRSYGGATLVVEQLASHLAARDDTEIHIATSLDSRLPDQATTRTRQGDINIIAIPISGGTVAEFDDPIVGAEFAHILQAVQPHIVHLHSIQWLSTSLAAACLQNNIPYVITVHDAWWLCARQFMVREDGTYCFQKKIDLHICQNCVPEARHLQLRHTLMMAALEGAAHILAPSEAHRQLYIANGTAPDRISVSPNGVRLPQAPIQRTPGAKLRFAYVGGNVEIKGFSLVKRAFEALTSHNWQLRIVDNTLNLGFSSVSLADWHVRGELNLVPAYTQDALDSFFADIDVLLFPSQWKESFGLTVREALARHVWVIATEGGGPAEAIQNGINGTLIKLDGHYQTLQTAIENLLSAPEKLKNHRNPHADTIIDFAAQADATYKILKTHALAAG